jgi:GNAT superfamily N-acetyltransferase
VAAVSEPETIGDWFPRAIDDGDPFVYGVTAVRGTTVVGFGLLGWYTAEELADYLTETPDVDAAYPAPVLHLGVVDEQHENQGIATRLMQARVQHAQQQDASYLWGASWRRSGKDSAPVFERCDFQPVHHVNDYYSDRTWCPDCGDTCTCSATIYRRTL